MQLAPAPEWQTTTWLNTAEPLGLERLRGRVVLLHAFQMLCPGCTACFLGGIRSFLVNQ